MELKWTPELPNLNETTSSSHFEADNRTFQIHLTNRDTLFLSIEYFGGSYSDVITHMKFDINGIKKDITYSFNRHDSCFSFPIPKTQALNILVTFTVHPHPYNSKSETGYVGMRNLGATCYMNSYLQSLFHLKAFSTSLFQQEPKRKTFQLQKLFYKLMNDSDIDTRSFVNNCRWFSDVFTHQDVHEFGKLVFDVLEEENKKKEKDNNGKENNNNGNENNETKAEEQSDFFIDKLFQGKINNYIKCECGCKRSIEEKFYEIQLDIRDWCGNPVANNIIEGLKMLKKEEILEGDNKYRCEKHGLVNAVKGIEFVQVPPIATVLLKRFSMDINTGEGYKINDFYQFYDRIEIKKGDTNNNCVDANNNNMCVNKGKINPSDNSNNDHINYTDANNNSHIINNSNGDNSNNADANNNNMVADTNSESHSKNNSNDNGKEHSINNTGSNNNIITDPLSSDDLNKIPKLKIDVDANNDIIHPAELQGLHDLSSESGESNFYKLFGVITHSGVSNDGHYYCYLNVNGWYKFNDTVVTKVSEEEALFDNFGGAEPLKGREKYHSAYLLIYINEKEWNNIINKEIILGQELKEKITLSESGKMMRVNLITNNELNYYKGIGIFNVNDEDYMQMGVKHLDLRSDDTLYVLGKDSFLENRYIYDVDKIKPLSNDDTIEENKNYFLFETNVKRKKGDILVFTKRYYEKEKCFMDEDLGLETKGCYLFNKEFNNISELKEKSMIQGDNVIFYIEENNYEINNDSINSEDKSDASGNMHEDNNNNTVSSGKLNDTGNNYNMHEINNDDDIDNKNDKNNMNADNNEYKDAFIHSSDTNDVSLNKADKDERKSLKKEINALIDEKENNRKRYCQEKHDSLLNYSIRPYDINKNFKENNIKNGSIIIAMEKESEEKFKKDYCELKSRKLVTLKTDAGDLRLYLNRNFDYPLLSDYVKKLFINDSIQINKFTGTIEFNKMKEVKIKSSPGNKMVQICYGVNQNNFNDLEHMHFVCLENLDVKTVFKKISVLDCFASPLKEFISSNKNYDIENEEEPMHNLLYDKILYEKLKENFLLLEIYEGNPYFKEFKDDDKISGDGRLVLREKKMSTEIKMILCCDNKMVGYPILLDTEDVITLKDLRIKYGILNKISRYDGTEEEEMYDDDTFVLFTEADVLLNHGYE